MAVFSFTVPDTLALELAQIAKSAGFPNFRTMVIAYLTSTIRASRGTKALAGVRESAEAKADIDTAGIS